VIGYACDASSSVIPELKSTTLTQSRWSVVLTKASDLSFDAGLPPGRWSGAGWPLLLCRVRRVPCLIDARPLRFFAGLGALRVDASICTEIRAEPDCARGCRPRHVSSRV